MRRLSILAAAAVVLSGCGGQQASTNATGTATTTGETAVKAFFYRDAALVPVGARVPQTQAVARAAIEQLLAGPPAGDDTALPKGVRLEDVTIEGGVATASFSSQLGEPPRTAQAQIVATLMQFPTVQGVVIQVEGKPVPLENGAGEQLARATDADYVDLTAEALIFVRTPARDSTVSSPVHAAGTADVFEATFQVEIWSGGKLVDTRTITATAGSGTPGTWAATLPVPSGEVRLVFYEPSAADGSHLHETEVLLHVR
jgi:Sporulation and spore germination/Immunoglobulin-like domain of bacterial spore germination